MSTIGSLNSIKFLNYVFNRVPKFPHIHFKLLFNAVNDPVVRPLSSGSHSLPFSHSFDRSRFRLAHVGPLSVSLLDLVACMIEFYIEYRVLFILVCEEYECSFS